MYQLPAFLDPPPPRRVGRKLALSFRGSPPPPRRVGSYGRCFQHRPCVHATKAASDLPYLSNLIPCLAMRILPPNRFL